jgi:hypothetical protein
MRKALREIKLKIFSWSPALGPSWHLIWRLIRWNYVIFLVLSLAVISAALFYAQLSFCGNSSNTLMLTATEKTRRNLKKK